MRADLVMIELEWIYKNEGTIIAAGRDTKYDSDNRKKKIIEFLDSQEDKNKSRLITPEQFKAAIDLHAIILTPESIQQSCDLLNNKVVAELKAEEIPF